MTDNNYTLLMQLGPSQGETLSIQGDEFVLGRDPESNWSIEDVEVSRGHARLIAREGGYAIEDMGSTNGTFVNGQRIRSVLQLDPGSTIRLGENVLLFYDTATEGKALEDTQDKEETVEEEIPQMEILERAESEKPAPPPAKAQTSVPDEPVPLSTVRENLPTEIPFYRRPAVIAVAVILLVGSLALSAFLWYVDANFLWCDVFGTLIAGC
jgi:pSer/pThr/pTyr-binding forkhead associated (FHA) protein